MSETSLPLLSPRPLRHSPRQASQLKLSGRYVILAVMPGVDYVSADEPPTITKLRYGPQDLAYGG